MDLNFLNKRVLVLGLGIHGGGVAVARWLAKREARVTVSDAKSAQELAPSIRALKGLRIRFALGKTHTSDLLKNCDLIIKNPAVPRELPFLAIARKKKIPIENEASLFLKLCPSKLVIGITGSKGKSTTTTLLGAMIKNYNSKTIIAGNIRDTVLFDVLDKVSSKTPVVLELSSWQLEQVGEHRLHTPISVITNIYPEHLNRYRGLKDYARSKSYIFKYQHPSDAVVLNADNTLSRGFIKSAKSRVYLFSVKKKVTRGCYVQNGAVWWKDRGVLAQLFKLKDLKIIGEHNIANALAATTAAKLAGVSLSAIRKAVRSFTGLHDRLELVRTVRGVEYYNDTTATAPVATMASLEALKNRTIILIAGGVDKNLPYAELAAVIKKHVCTLILLPGTATAKLQRELISSKVAGFPSCLLASTMSEAVRLADVCAQPKSVVLLSPAAASFGLFKHEFDRGEQFVKAVKYLR